MTIQEKIAESEFFNFHPSQKIISKLNCGIELKV